MISIQEYLIKKGFPYRMRGDEAVFNCPFCDDKEKKFAVNVKSGAFQCFHLNNCGAKGSFRELQERLGDVPERTYIEKEPFYRPLKKTFTIPKVSIPPISTPETDYLSSRGFTQKTREAFRVSGKDGVIMLPYYKDGVLVNVKYRAIAEKKMWAEKDAEPCLFGRDLVKGNVLYICEGEYDAMALYQMGFDDGAVSVSNGVSDFRWVETEWEWLERFKEIYILMDMDDAGRRAAVDLSKKLGTWRCKDVSLPHKDVNECLQKGVTIEQLSECMSCAREYRPAMLVGVQALENDVVELFRDGRNLVGVPTIWKKLDDLLGGWREEELTVWTGRTGAGKSTILNQHLIDMAEKGVRICVASLELPAPRYLRWALIQMYGTPELTEMQIRQGLRKLNGMVYIVNTHESIGPDDLFEIFEYASRRYDCRHYIVDSLMRIKLPRINELKEEGEFTDRLLSFAKKYKGHVHLVAHPRKAAKDNELPGVVDIRGSGHITDLAHNVIVHWRPTEDELKKAADKKKNIPGGVLYVKKNRELGTVGRIRLTYNERAKCYRDDFDELEEMDNPRNTQRN